MPRRSSAHAPPTALAAAVVALRGTRTQAEVAAEMMVSQRTVSTIERGGPLALATASAIAKWLGWTIEQVIEASRAPAP